MRIVTLRVGERTWVTTVRQSLVDDQQMLLRIEGRGVNWVDYPFGGIVQRMYVRGDLDPLIIHEWSVEIEDV